jgi:hypothetical protein
MGLGAAGAEGRDRMRVWLWLTMLAGLYCAIRGGLDLRDGQYLWGAIGLVCAAALLLTPIRSQAVKYDVLPPDTQ